jgi:hypothetical protein
MGATTIRFWRRRDPIVMGEKSVAKEWDWRESGLRKPRRRASEGA